MHARKYASHRARATSSTRAANACGNGRDHGGVLLFTAAVTPYEVAFLETEWNALFWLNRLIDLLFVGDMVKNFVCIYFDSRSRCGCVTRGA